MILKDYVWAELRDNLIATGTSWAVEPAHIEEGAVGTLMGHPIFVEKTWIKTEGQIIDEENARLKERTLLDIDHGKKRLLRSMNVAWCIGMIDDARKNGHHVVGLRMTDQAWESLRAELDAVEIQHAPSMGGVGTFLGLPVRVGARSMPIVNDEAKG